MENRASQGLQVRKDRRVLSKVKMDRQEAKELLDWKERKDLLENPEITADQ